VAKELLLMHHIHEVGELAENEFIDLKGLINTIINKNR
jgi:hypothetical protein